MYSLMIFCNIIYFSKSIQQNNLIDQKNLKNKNLFFKDLGFYSVLIQADNKLDFYLNEGKQSVFFYIPYYPSFFINYISIDGVAIKRFVFPRGFSIEGKENATISFFSENNDFSIQANFWIIPSSTCQKSSIYVYGSNSIEIHARTSELCIFSPTFDSSSHRFKIESGIPFDDGFHSTFIFIKNFTNPDYVNYGNKIDTYTFKTGSLIKFYASNPQLRKSDIFNSKTASLKSSNEYYTIHYKRKTRSGSIAFIQNECISESIYKCNSIECVTNPITTFSQCIDYDIEMITIVGSIIGAFFAIGMLIMISCIFVKKKKKNQNQNVNPVPLRSEYEKEDDTNYINPVKPVQYPPQ